MTHRAVCGVVLAGGRSRRMDGRDKALLTLGGRTLLDRVAARLAPQCPLGLVLNANGDPGRFAGSGLAVAEDATGDFPGPLAGILAGLDWAAEHRPACEWVASATVDAPFIPGDLVSRLAEAQDRSGHALAVARSGGRDHVAHGLWPVSLRERLRDAIAGGERRVGRWAAGQGYGVAEWPAGPPDPFLNVNTPDDLLAAARLLALATDAERQLDLAGLKCPLPALKTAKALRALAAGEVLVVACTDPMAAIDIPNLVRERGDRLLGSARREGALEFRIMKG